MIALHGFEPGSYVALKLFGYWDAEYKLHYPVEIGKGLIELGERFNLIPLYCES